jgi:uncharacterized protein involved in exopolysaccharide biosynthesis
MGEMLSVVWARRTRLFGIWAAVMVVVLIRVLTMADMYTSSALLTPLPLEQVEQQVQGGMAGTSVRSLLNVGSRRDDYAIAAFLQSRQLLDAVIADLNLGPELFPGRWDSKANEWSVVRGGRPSAGALRRKMVGLIDTSYEEFTGLLSVSAHWPEPERAHAIAKGLVEVADRTLRDAAIAEGERRIVELEREMGQTAVGEVGAYLAEEMTRAISSLTSIRARAQYAFRVIDPPVVPDRPSWPPRLLLVLLAAFATAAIEIGVVVGAHLRREGSRGK